VVKNGSVSEAARQIGLTQSAVSKAVTELERSMATPLMDRTVRPIAPTRAGSLLYDRAAELLNDMRHLRAAVGRAADPLLPSLRIGVVDSVMVAGPALVKVLRTLAHEVRVVSGLTPELGRGLWRRDFDLLVTSDPMDDSQDLRREELVREPFILVVPAQHAKSARGMTLKALAAELPMVRYTTRSMIGIAIEQHLGRLGLKIPRSLELDHSTSLLDIVGAGLGWAITTPLCLLQGRLPPGVVAMHRLPGPQVNRRLFCASRLCDPPELSARIGDLITACLRARLVTHYTQAAPWVMPEIQFGGLRAS
jgi:DNA-binding transcriptional LysR family regulator